MSFSSVVIVAILFFCISVSSASVIPDGKTAEYENSNESKGHFTERGTKYFEKIAIDEENGLEYFHVPAHNGLTEADYLYDFRSNISVRRENSKASCYLGPLPDDLSKPSDPRTGLQRESETPSKGDVTVQKYWFVSEEVDKTLLRREVQDFCGQFPVYRLQEVDLPRSLAAGLNSNVGRTRFARRIDLNMLVLCDLYSLPSRNCNPLQWLYSLQIRDCYGIWWVRDCKFDPRTKRICREWERFFKNMVCYKIRCP